MSCISGVPYIVKPGDTLVSIARRQWSDASRWREIKKSDGYPFTEDDVRHLQLGQEVCLKNTDELKPPSGNNGFTDSRNAPSGNNGFTDYRNAPSGNNGFTDIISRQTYEAIFPRRNSIYTYENLVAAVQKYPNFSSEGTLVQRKREVAAFLANIAHETSSLHYVEEIKQQNWPKYCKPNNTYPCIPGRTYQGRGPLQLSWNYNYGAVGTALGVDLLSNPDLVKTNGDISFQTALWFWMTPQSPKPSSHEVMSGGWQPSVEDWNRGRTPGFGMTVNIINGGRECSIPTTPQVSNRVNFYQRFTQMLGVDMGENIYCDRMDHY